MFLFGVESFLNQEIRQFMTILNFILILSLISFSICLFWIVSPFVVITLLSIFLSKLFTIGFSAFASLRSCSLYIHNNLKLHQKANFRLSLLTNISLTFIVFSACLLRLQATNLYVNVRQSIPSDIVVTSSSLDEASLAPFLREFQATSLVSGFSFLEGPVSVSQQQFQSLHLSTLADFETLSPLLYPLNSEYLSLVYR